MIYTLTLNPALDKTFLVEVFEFNGVNRPFHTGIESGGKGFNVSRALKRLGLDTCALGFIGGGTGEYIQSDLRRQGISTAFVKLEGETRTNLVLRENSGRYIKINDQGPDVTESDLTALGDLMDSLVVNGDLWVLCGSLPRGAPLNIYKVLIEQLHASGAVVALDTSGEPLRLALEAQPDLIKPNQFEAWEILGNHVRLYDIPLRFHEMGIGLVVLSLGEGGLVVSDPDQSFIIRTPSLEVKNPVGAGDAALSGAIFAILQKLPLPVVGKWAAASGTAAAISSSNCFDTVYEVENIINQLVVEEL